MATAAVMFPVIVPNRAYEQPSRIDVLRDILEVFRSRGIESRATPAELDQIAHGARSIESVLL